MHNNFVGMVGPEGLQQPNENNLLHRLTTEERCAILRAAPRVLANLFSPSPERMSGNRRRRARKALRALYGDACHWCGGEMDFEWAVGNSNSEFASIEHLTPLSEGGSDDYENLRLAHLRCNHKRNESASQSGDAA